MFLEFDFEHFNRIVNFLTSDVTRRDHSERMNFIRPLTGQRGDVITHPEQPGFINFHKRQLILNTIQDLKRNLEDQSFELCGLNDDNNNNNNDN